MKATGIVRRIDDLGRVVIPKEIRRTLRIRESDPLEIFTDRNGQVIFKKYSPLGELAGFSGALCEALSRSSGVTVAVTDRDLVLYAAGSARRELEEQTLSQELEQRLESRQTYRWKTGEPRFYPTSGGGANHVGILVPVISQGDLLGGILFLYSQDQAPGDSDLLLAQTASAFLSRQLEG